MNKLGLYIHIPFCQSRCYYCDFASSIIPHDQQIEKYVSYLIRELDFACQKFNLLSRELDTIYFGGGTPSLLKSSYFRTILESIRLKWPNFKGEFTIEGNPNSLTEDLIIDLKKMGLNRVSVGIQSLNDATLQAVGRAHDSKRAIECLNMLNKQNTNMSIDLMIGLPGQTKEDIKYYINGTIDKFEINHISTYLLTVEKNTKLFNLVKDKKIFLMSDDEKVELLDYASTLLKERGFTRYEVSNFARIGHESKHNMKYWQMHDYLGIGLSSHSLINNIRFYNPDSFDEYFSNIEQNKYLIEEELSNIDFQQEYVMLAFRTTRGINLKDYLQRFNKDFLIQYKDKINKYNKYLSISNFNVGIKEQYFNVLNQIVSDFI